MSEGQRGMVRDRDSLGVNKKREKENYTAYT